MNFVYMHEEHRRKLLTLATKKRILSFTCKYSSKNTEKYRTMVPFKHNLKWILLHQVVKHSCSSSMQPPANAYIINIFTPYSLKALQNPLNSLDKYKTVSEVIHYRLTVNNILSHFTKINFNIIFWPTSRSS